MSTRHGFTSAFAADLEAYLAFKESMGCYGASRIWYLGKFDTYCTARNRELFDRDTVEEWVSEQLTRSGRYRSWMSYIRDFGRWLQARGHNSAYVLSDEWKAPFVPANPYLLTQEEIEAFFGAVTRLQASSPWAWQACAFFTLMHCCGLRTGEARALGTTHVNLTRAYVDIIDGKGNRSRRLPLTSDVTGILRSCDHLSQGHFPDREAFFVSAKGSQVSPAAVGVIFHRIWDQANLPRHVGGPGPRPYSFRHHFAYANIERWATDGKDVTAMLPYLAAYMGHATFGSTYYYVHTSPDFMTSYADTAAPTAAAVLPEVGFE